MNHGCIAIDWGTTNRRVHRLAADGRTLDTVRDRRGVLAMRGADYAAEIGVLRAAHGALPVVAAGMVGSDQGWRAIPHVAAPAGREAIARGIARIAGDVAIVPGVALIGGTRGDVMRGEEVQVIGAIAAGLAPAEALFCQPGTHSKWIATQQGEIVDFTTAMTGELFALLRSQGTLAAMLCGPVSDGPAFRDGLARGRDCRDLAAALFEIRARVLLGTLPRADAAACASGILIGANVGARSDLDARPVHLLARGELAELYGVAITEAGGRAIVIDSDAAFVAGIRALRETLA